MTRERSLILLGVVLFGSVPLLSAGTDQTHLHNLHVRVLQCTDLFNIPSFSLIGPDFDNPCVGNKGRNVAPGVLVVLSDRVGKLVSSKYTDLRGEVTFQEIPESVSITTISCAEKDLEAYCQILTITSVSNQELTTFSTLPTAAPDPNAYEAEVRVNLSNVPPKGTFCEVTAGDPSGPPLNGSVIAPSSAAKITNCNQPFVIAIQRGALQDDGKFSIIAIVHDDLGNIVGYGYLLDAAVPSAQQPAALTIDVGKKTILDRVLVTDNDNDNDELPRVPTLLCRRKGVVYGKGGMLFQLTSENPPDSAISVPAGYFDEFTFLVSPTAYDRLLDLLQKDPTKNAQPEQKSAGRVPAAPYQRLKVYEKNLPERLALRPERVRTEVNADYEPGSVCRPVFRWSDVPEFMNSSLVSFHFRRDDRWAHAHYGWHVWSPASAKSFILPQLPTALENCEIWSRWSGQGILEEVVGAVYPDYGVQSATSREQNGVSTASFESAIFQIILPEEIHLPTLNVRAK